MATCIRDLFTALPLPLNRSSRTLHTTTCTMPETTGGNIFLTMENLAFLMPLIVVCGTYVSVHCAALLTRPDPASLTPFLEGILQVGTAEASPGDHCCDCAALPDPSVSPSS